MHSRKRSKEISAIESNSPINCPRIDRITSKKYSVRRAYGVGLGWVFLITIHPKTFLDKHGSIV